MAWTPIGGTPSDIEVSFVLVLTTNDLLRHFQAPKLGDVDPLAGRDTTAARWATWTARAAPEAPVHFVLAN